MNRQSPQVLLSMCGVLHVDQNRRTLIQHTIMIFTKVLVPKAIVVLVAAAMVFSVFAPSARAQTTADLQQLINNLLAQVAALQAQVGQGGTGTASGICPYTWTRNLSIGATGADVMKLQQFLNADPDTRVAAAGAGSVGMETQYYGPLTAAAVSKMQVKYRAEVLTPLGLVNPTGFFGPSSRAKANSVCIVAPPVTPPATTTPTTTPPVDEDLQGEGTLSDFIINPGPVSNIEEGDTDVVVAEAILEASNGDIEISRMDIQLTADSGNDQRNPWNTFESVSLWIDGDRVAEVDADNRDDYLNRNNGILRFTGLDLIVREDEEVMIEIAVSVQGAVRGATTGDAEWDIEVDAIRYFDADGVATDDRSSFDIGTPVTFDIGEAGEGEELRFSLSSDNPRSTGIQVDETSRTNNVTILAYEIESRDNDIELNELAVRIDTSTTTTNVINDINLLIDGRVYRDTGFTAVSTTSRTYTFDIDGRVTIDRGDRAEVEVQVNLNAQSGNYPSGTTIRATALVNETDAEGANTLTGSQLRGSAIGDLHTLVSTGLVVPAGSVESSASVTSVEGTANDYATYRIEFDVTAVEQDVYINANETVSLEYDIVTPGGDPVATGTRTAVIDSTADEVSGYFRIREGQSENVSVTVTYVPGTAGVAARMQIEAINYAASPVSPTDTWNALPVSDYRTNVAIIVN